LTTVVVAVVVVVVVVVVVLLVYLSREGDNYNERHLFQHGTTIPRTINE
jgi:hypothetical protein